MANNRVYLLCDICELDDSALVDDCVFVFAAHDPSTFAAVLDQWLQDHQHGCMEGQHLHVRYERETRDDHGRDFSMPCVTCGHPIELRHIAGVWEMLPHYECDRPTVNMICDNPRRLGVIASES